MGGFVQVGHSRDTQLRERATGATAGSSLVTGVSRAGAGVHVQRGVTTSTTCRPRQADPVTQDTGHWLITGMITSTVSIYNIYRETEKDG